LSTIQSDVATDFNTGDLDLDDAANAFLAKFADNADDDASKKKPSEKGETSEDDVKPQEEQDHDEANEDEGEQSDESPDEETEGDEGDEDGQSEDDGKTEDEKKYAESDDIFVKVKVDGEEKEVSVKDLKRLYGQETALMRKNQEVAAERTKVEQSQAKSLAALDVMVKRAKEAADPFRQVNWVALAKDPNVTAEQVNALQEMAKAAADNETFLTQQLDAFMGHIQEQQKAERVKAANECLRTLNDEKSPLHIKGWNDGLYNDLRAFGVEVGLNKAMVDGLTDPAAFKLLHMAMQFHKGAKKVQTVKVNKAPKKIVKTSTAVTKTSSTGSKVNVDRTKAVSKLKQTGSMKDAEAAFLASFQD
jgi:hypothetical protein